jgi:hypothetical protein
MKAEFRILIPVFAKRMLALTLLRNATHIPCSREVLTFPVRPVMSLQSAKDINLSGIWNQVNVDIYIMLVDLE